MIRKLSTTVVLWALCALFHVNSIGQSVTTLESFEDMDSITVLDAVIEWNTARTDFDIFETGGQGDVGQVTDGEKALEVYFFDTLSSWGQDFQILLSEEASGILMDAWNTEDPHRYWLIYDITFESGDAGWANNPFWIGPGATYGDQVEVNGNWDTPISGYIELDAARNGGDLTPNEDNRIALGFGFNGNFNDARSVWVDNIRLLDTYAPGYEPSETVLEGFEDEDFFTLATSSFEVFSHQKIDALDTGVTEGERSARIEVFDGGWTTAATLDLSADDTLNDLLFETDPDERWNYILSFDYQITPDTDVTINWFQFITQTGGTRLTPDWGNGASRTYSMNLGSLNWEDTVPVINMVTQGGFDGFVDVFMDNVRLINTKGTKSTTGPLTPADITSIDVADDSVTLTFSSVAGGTYTILSTMEVLPDADAWTAIGDAVTASDDTTTWTDERALQSARYYMVRREP